MYGERVASEIDGGVFGVCLLSGTRDYVYSFIIKRTPITSLSSLGGPSAMAMDISPPNVTDTAVLLCKKK